MDLTPQLAEATPADHDHMSRHHAEEAQEQPSAGSLPNCAILGTASRVTSRMTSVLKEAMAITGGRQEVTELWSVGRAAVGFEAVAGLDSVWQVWQQA